MRRFGQIARLEVSQWFQFRIQVLNVEMLPFAWMSLLNKYTPCIPLNVRRKEGLGIYGRGGGLTRMIIFKHRTVKLTQALVFVIKDHPIV